MPNVHMYFHCIYNCPPPHFEALIVLPSFNCVPPHKNKQTNGCGGHSAPLKTARVMLTAYLLSQEC